MTTLNEKQVILGKLLAIMNKLDQKMEEARKETNFMLERMRTDKEKK